MYTYELRDNRCTFTFDTSSEALCRSIFATKLLSGTTANPAYTKLSFHAHCIHSLEEFVRRQPNQSTLFTYADALNMVKDLGAQIFHMEKQARSLLWLDMDHVFVVNRQHFFYFGHSHVTTTYSDRTMMFSTPTQLSRHRFVAPEFSDISALPASLNQAAVYYSLGAMTIYCLFADVDPQNIRIADMMPILDTKLYWFLLRATERDPNKRVLLFV